MHIALYNKELIKKGLGATFMLKCIFVYHYRNIKSALQNLTYLTFIYLVLNAVFIFQGYVNDLQDDIPAKTVLICIHTVSVTAPHYVVFLAMKRYSGYLKRPEILETVYSVEVRKNRKNYLTVDFQEQSSSMNQFVRKSVSNSHFFKKTYTLRNNIFFYIFINRQCFYILQINKL